MADIFQSTFEDAPIGIIHLAIDATILRANAAFHKMLGYAPFELRGVSIYEFTYPEDMPASTALISAMVNDELSVVNFDKRYRRKDGSTMWVSITTRLLRDLEGNPLYFVGFLQDVTERKQVEQAVRESEGRLRFALEAANVFTWFWNETLNRFFTSDRYHLLFGLSDPDPEWNSTKFMNSVHEDDRPWVRLLLDEWYRSGGLFEQEFRIRWPDKTVRWLYCKAQAQTDEKTGHMLRSGICIDITSHKETELLIKEQQAKMVAASKMSTLGEMSGGIAHEINNPLTIIHGRAVQLKQMAQAGLATPDLVQKIAEKIETTALRISKIVRSLKAFARETDHVPFQTVPIKSIIEDTIEFCRERFKNHDIEFKVGPVPDNIEVECHPVQIGQVLLNLLNNAHDATQDTPERWIELSVTEKKDVVLITVTDSGEGIPAGVAEKIFQPFFTTKEVGKGTGLGLSVSKGLVENHSGRIYLDEAAQNTRFIVELPIRIH